MVMVCPKCGSKKVVSTVERPAASTDGGQDQENPLYSDYCEECGFLGTAIEADGKKPRKS